MILHCLRTVKTLFMVKEHRHGTTTLYARDIKTFILDVGEVRPRLSAFTLCINTGKVIQTSGLTAGTTMVADRNS